MANLKPGDVVIFHTGHNDKYLRPQPADAGLWLDPLQGKSEGWPAPGPDAIAYLKEKGIRCVASDAPDLGGVDPRQALMTYWALGSREMVGVEFLRNVDKIPKSRERTFSLPLSRCATAMAVRDERLFLLVIGYWSVAWSLVRLT